jgi:acetyl-CoA synthetase
LPSDTIHKDRSAGCIANLSDYEEVRRVFSWDQAPAELDGLPGSGLNIAWEAVDRHVLHGDGRRRAIVWLGKDGGVRVYSYTDLAKLSNRFAHVLRRLGIGRGDRVFALLGRIPELYIERFSEAGLMVRKAIGTRCACAISVAISTARTDG